MSAHPKFHCHYLEQTGEQKGEQKGERAGAVPAHIEREDDFLATLAHELRNPLAPIRNALEIMRVADNDTAALTTARHMIERQVDTLSRLFDDLLDVSRAVRGQLTLDRERLTLSSVIKAAVAISRPLIETKQHRLYIELPREPLHLDGDPHRLAQVFAKLLHNSAKYSTAGGHIAVHAERRDREIVVSVTDRGLGIPREVLPRVFDLFVQAKRTASSSQDGLGLGLTLAKRLVELHGGSIEVHSEGTGHGSRFVVRLPAASAPQAIAPARREGEVTNAERLVSARVLVADDNRDAALSLALLLQLSGYETRTAFDGLEAVEIAEEFRPDVVLLDIGMPRLDGYGAAKELRARPWARGVLICALTGWEQEIASRRSGEAAFDHHFVKPVDPQKLQARLEEGLRGR